MSVLVSGWVRGCVGVEQCFKKTLRWLFLVWWVCGYRGWSPRFILQVMLLLVMGGVFHESCGVCSS